MRTVIVVAVDADGAGAVEEAPLEGVGGGGGVAGAEPGRGTRRAGPGPGRRA